MHKGEFVIKQLKLINKLTGEKMYKKKQVTDREFLQNLEACFEEAFSDEKELERLLVHQGYDPKKDVEEGLKFINGLLFKRKVAKARLKKERIEDLFKKVSEKYRSIIPADLDSFLNNVLSGSEKISIQTAFREFQELDDEDKRGIIEDTELLSEIEKIRSDDDTNE